MKKIIAIMSLVAGAVSMNAMAVEAAKTAQEPVKAEKVEPAKHVEVHKEKAAKPAVKKEEVKDVKKDTKEVKDGAKAPAPAPVK